MASIFFLCDYGLMFRFNVPCRGGAGVRARAVDTLAGRSEFESHHCHVTGHMPVH